MHLWLLALSGHFKVTRQTDKLPPFCSCCTMVWPERFWREMVVGVRCWVLIVCLNGRLVRRVRFHEVKPQANVTLQNSLQHLLGKKVPKKVQHQKRWGQYHGFTDSAKSLEGPVEGSVSDWSWTVGHVVSGCSFSITAFTVHKTHRVEPLWRPSHCSIRHDASSYVWFAIV